MTRVAGVLFAAMWVGATLVLAEVRWFRRARLAQRLAPFAPGGSAGGRHGTLSVASFRDVVVPLSRSLGEALARAFGIDEPLAVRLARVHSPLDVTAFRVRQAATAGVALAAGTTLAVAVTPPVPVAALLVFGSPLLGFLVVEQRLAAQSDAWKRRLTLELPVVCEQLGMLVGSGYSVGAAIARVAGRGRGACARDLTRVVVRVRQGLSEPAALREWADTARVDAVDRLVAVLTHNRDASDLGRLISEEARALRRDGQRRLIETIERKGQLVWIPVTVATLLPGVIFLAVPFLEVMRLFTTS